MVIEEMIALAILVVIGLLLKHYAPNFLDNAKESAKDMTDLVEVLNDLEEAATKKQKEVKLKQTNAVYLPRNTKKKIRSNHIKSSRKKK